MDKSGQILRVLDVRHLFATLPEEHRSSSAIATIKPDKLGFTDLDFKISGLGLSVREITLPSLCSFHWKEERNRFDMLSILLSVSRAEYPQNHGWVQWPMLYQYAFTPRKSETEPLKLALVGRRLFDPTPIIRQTGANPSLSCLVEQLPLSARSIMRLILYNKIGNSSHELAMLSSSLTLSKLHGRLDVHQFDVDHLSGAMILTRKGNRWIKIVYPA